MPFDGKAFGAEIVEAVKLHVATATRPLLDKIAALEKELAAVPRIDQAAIERIVSEQVAKLPPAAPGKDADPEAVRAMIAEEVAKLPPAAPGKDADPEAVRAMIAEEVQKLPPAEPGKDADPEATRELVVNEVERAVNALPKPKDGESFTIEQAAPLIADAVAKAVGALPKPKDGAGLADALIDREGRLVLTLTDGSARTLGQVVGRDADLEKMVAAIKAEVDKIPRPKDGEDGLGFEDIEVLHDGEREFGLRFMRGEKIKEFTFTQANTIYRGVWKEGKYEKGDSVTWGGSSFIALCETETKPGESDHWQLAVKRGRDGKNVNMEEVKAMIERMVTLAVKGLRPPEKAS